MGCLVSSGAALLLTSLLAFLFGVSSVLGQDLRESDAQCNADGCFVVYFQRKTFLDSWRACKEKGGNLATIKRKEDATTIAILFSALDLRHSRTEVRVWIGLQRQPRQCNTARPLRGFSWTTGDQDTEYTNWRREDSPGSCAVPRCVVVGYNLQQTVDNFKWQDGSCSDPADGYLCHYGYKGMCPALWNEGGGHVLYATPFDLLSTLLTHVPLGSGATVPCPAGADEEQSVLCTLKGDGSVGWSRDSPLCPDPLESHNWCGRDNGGCEHFCRPAGEHFYCECADEYQLGDDGWSCEMHDVCREAGCEFECLALPDGHRCACPEGYMLAPDERGCLDVDECLQSPCEQLCENAPGTFECRCRDGYHPDDEGGCEDLDECMDDPCEHACENTLGSHICHCDLGFSPVPEDTRRCQDTDECQIPGTCEQMCVNYEGGFQCFCEEGYKLMSDLSSCQKRGEGDDHTANYDWTADEEPTLKWLTDPPRVLNPDVIWVTSTPPPKTSASTEPDPYEDDTDTTTALAIPSTSTVSGGAWNRRPGLATSSSPPGNPEDSVTDRNTALAIPSTSTVSGGAWNRRPGLATSSRPPGNPEDSVTDRNAATDPSDRDEGGEDRRPLQKFPGEELGGEGEEKNDYVEMAHSQEPTALTQPVSSQPTSGGAGQSGDTSDSPWENSEREHSSSTWLLVGLLVPVCVLILVMLALAIVYCTNCALRPRGKNVSECYHWISGAHDPQGAPNPSAGVKTCV